MRASFHRLFSPPSSSFAVDAWWWEQKNDGIQDKVRGFLSSYDLVVFRAGSGR